MSNLPPAVRKQIKAANQQVADFKANRNGQPAPPVAAPPAPPVAAPPAPPSHAPAGLQPVTQFVPGNDQPPAGFTPTDPAFVAAAPPPSATDPAVAPVSAPPAPPEDFRQKYRVLQGKYNADVTTARTEAAVLRDQLALANARVSQPAPSSAAPAPSPLASVVTPEEMQEYGPELVNLMQRVAAAAVQPHVQRVENEVQNVRNTAAQGAEELRQAARARVYQALLSFDADWEFINNSDEFLAWLAQVDVISGLTRKQGLLNAFEKNDAARVVNIFKLFKEEDSRSRSTAPRVPTVDPATLIAPGPAGGSAPTAPDANVAKIWSEEEIGVFNTRVRQRKISADERVRIEAAIMQAVQEGRVRPTVNTANLANAMH